MALPPRFKIRRLSLTASALACSLAAVGISAAPAAPAAPDASGRPTVANCALTQPPPGSGEETDHNVLIQAYPRIQDMGASYSGCQAVFITARDRPAALAWLIEVKRGDPVRIWSDDESLQPVLACRVSRGQLVTGDPKVCKPHSIQLLPTMPAGCAATHQDPSACDYDAE